MDKFYLQDVVKHCPVLSARLKSRNAYIEKMKTSVTRKLNNNNYHYDPEMLDKVKKLMKEFAEHVTVRCMDYEIFEHFVYMMLVNGFGTWLIIPSFCSV